jgi:hypothetical protein
MMKLCSSYDVTWHQHGRSKFAQEVPKIATLEGYKIGSN